MTDTPEPVRLTSLSHGAGCACKLSLEELQEVLVGATPSGHPDLLVGLDTGDDAAVWRRPSGPALVATTDFFTALVDDPRTWGRIAAANAVSDCYAMGGTPLFALNLVAWPRALGFEHLREVLAGADDIARDAGLVVAGGHTIDGAEPLFGQAVVGEVDPAAMLTNAGGRAGDVLVLTKPLGTGIVTTALKRSTPADLDDGSTLATAYAAAVASMVRLNADAAAVATGVAASAATDVTGFGLLGHLHRLASASGLAARVEAAAVPLLPGVRDLRDRGFVPGGTQRNADQARAWLADDVGEPTRLLLADAQTSGGLLFACAADRADAACDRLLATGHDAAVVGTLETGTPGAVRVVG